MAHDHFSLWISFTCHLIDSHFEQIPMVFHLPFLCHYGNSHFSHSHGENTSHLFVKSPMLPSKKKFFPRCQWIAWNTSKAQAFWRPKPARTDGVCDWNWWKKYVFFLPVILWFKSILIGILEGFKFDFIGMLKGFIGCFSRILRTLIGFFQGFRGIKCDFRGILKGFRDFIRI